MEDLLLKITKLDTIIQNTLIDFMQQVKNLKFAEQPNYLQLKQTLQTCLKHICGKKVSYKDKLNSLLDEKSYIL